ncbi:50S ribosomal protein L10 [Candidatus Nitrosacidococcus sp. I8]|uniref:50S ribosomal protein L10 n=1 Tax=Candidatus Nitrosacidococcus sp. I8 TaxID=2942908 RepID=UPI002226CCF4|nr:50S ribosomal protein L10 [Candidatus Nitrosacidococcus sp. I8]CAH9017247.1 50S ribosomal protein L10 [Candidatus Nitrosacidococcus sp. I8]
MSLNLEAKQTIVTEIANIASQAHSIVTAEYRGLTVSEITKIRVLARQKNVYLRVIRNTLVARALAGTDFECINSELKGPLIFAFSLEEPSAAARVIRDSNKEYNRLKIKSGALRGKLLPSEAINSLADMPTKDQAIAMLMGVLEGPISKFVRTLVEPVAKLARATAAVRDQKKE